MRLPFPAPLLGAAAALVFLYVEDNPIWGGTIASTLTGEFSYTYGVGFAVLFLGVLVRARGPTAGGPGLAGRRPRAHRLRPRLRRPLGRPHRLRPPALRPRAPGRDGSPVQSGSPLAARGRRAGLRPRRSALVPLARRLGLDDALRRRLDRPHDPRLPPAAPVAALPRRRGGARGDPGPAVRRPAGAPTGGSCCSASAPLAGAALASAGPGLGRDRRALRSARPALAGPRRGGRPRARPRAPRPRRRGRARPRPARGGPRGRLARASCAPGSTGTTRASRRRSCGRPGRTSTRGSEGGRATLAWPSSTAPVHERAGSIRMHETVPYFSGRSGIEGVYNQSSVTTHPVYYLALGALPVLAEPLPQPDLLALRPRDGARPAPPAQRGPPRRRDPGLVSALDARPEVVREARDPPVHALPRRLPGPGYVEPLAFAPVRAPPRRLARRVVPLVLAQAAEPRACSSSPTTRASTSWPDGPWAPPPERPLDGRRRGEGDGRGGVDPHHDEPAGPPPPREGLVPPALAGRRRGGALPRVPRLHARGAAPARGAPALRRAHVVGRAGGPSSRGRPSRRFPPAASAARSRGGRAPRRGGRSFAAPGRRAAHRARPGPRRAAARSGARATPARSTSSTSGRRAPSREERWADAAEYARAAVSSLPASDGRRAGLLVPPGGGAAACRSRAGGGRAVRPRRGGDRSSPAAGSLLGGRGPGAGRRRRGCGRVARGTPPRPRGNPVGAEARRAARRAPAVIPFVVRPVGVLHSCRPVGGREVGPGSLPRARRGKAEEGR